MRLPAAALFLFACFLPLHALAQCKLKQIGEWTVRLAGNQPVIDGAINGQKIGILLDTGASTSLMPRDAAERLKLPRQAVYGMRVYGVGGTSTPEAAEIAEFKLGEAIRKDWKVLVVDARAGNRFSFILGDDFFEQMELELDLPHSKMRFFLTTGGGCDGAALAYWNPDAVTLPLDSGRKIQFTTELNGIKLRTLLDTGASTSVVAMSRARAAGFDPDAPGAVSAGCSGGIGARTIDSWYAEFDRLKIGNQAIRNPTLRVSDLWRNVRRDSGSQARRAPEGVPDMLLGMDFLKTHRVFISRTQRQMYFTYEGGLVFPASPSIACEGLSTEREAPARIAEYSARIAANGKDVQALLARSRELQRSGDADGALRDLDALLAIEPANTAARLQRAEMMMQRKEHEKAIADYDAAIAGGVTTARVHAMRGIALRQKGDSVRALESFETALQLDPREPTALYWRGVSRVESGDKQGAQADLDLLEKIQPQGAAALRKRIEGGALR